MSGRAGALVFLIGLAGCADIIGLADYTVDGAGGAATTSTTTTGDVTATTSTGLGGSGGAPCVAEQEICNGLDDDCDGVADEPAMEVGEGCSGCTWALFEGRHYAICPVDVGACPGGTRITVFQSLEERDFLGQLVPVDEAAALGLTQAPNMIDLDAGWSWERTGMPIPWESGQPDDFGDPNFIESGGEECGFILSSASEYVGVHDASCSGFANFIACEEIADECRSGEPCALPGGCVGTWDCGVAGGACEPAPADEVCNGLDDDCNGVADDQGACSCTDADLAGMTYRFCQFPTTVEDMHCGEGFVPAMPKTLEQLNAMLSMISGYGSPVRIGVYQSGAATELASGWTYHDGNVFDPALWEGPIEPDDELGMTETHAQDCAMIAEAFPAVHDYYCYDSLGYLCEMVP